MQKRFPLIIPLFLFAFVFGALLGRRWKGDLADGVLTAVALATIILIIISYGERLRPWRGQVSWYHARGFAFAIAGLLLGYVLQQQLVLGGNQDRTAVVAAWVMAFGLYALGVAPPRRPTRPDWRAWWQVHGRTTLVLAAITVIALVLRVAQLGEIPFTLDGDEANFALESLGVLRGQMRDPFAVALHSQPTMSLFYSSWGISLLGPTLAAIRLPWAILGTLTIPVAFWLAARIKGPIVGLITAVLLATYHFHIQFSRHNLNNIGDPLWAGLALLFFYRALARHSRLDWAFFGAVNAWALYGYTGARLIPVLSLIALGYYALSDYTRFWQQHRLGLLIALGAFIVVAAPILEYGLRFPNDFNDRVRITDIFESGWLLRVAAVRGTSALDVLLDRFRLGLLVFNLYPEGGGFYGLPQPLLDPFAGALFLVGLGFATVRTLILRKDPQLFPMVAWWWSGIITGAVFSGAEIQSQRLITLALPVCFFIALALWQILQLARRAVAGLPQRELLTAGVILLSVSSLYIYFVDYTPRHLGGGIAAETMTTLAPILKGRTPPYHVYFFGAPRFTWNFPTMQFLLPNAQATDIVQPLTAPPTDLLPPGQGAFFIFIPGRVDELRLVRRAFPGGEVQEVFNSARQEELAVIYTVPPR